MSYSNTEWLSGFYTGVCVCTFLYSILCVNLYLIFVKRAKIDTCNITKLIDSVCVVTESVTSCIKNANNRINEVDKDTLSKISRDILALFCGMNTQTRSHK